MPVNKEFLKKNGKVDVDKWAKRHLKSVPWGNTVTVPDTGLYKKRKSTECCVCKDIGGTFYIENGKAFCSEHKEAMHFSEDKLKEYIATFKKRKKNG